MDTAWTLLLALLALHFAEGLYFVRREAVAFTRRGGQWRIGFAERSPGTGRRAFLLLDPFIPLAPTLVSEPLPFTPTPAGVVEGSVEAWSGPPSRHNKGLTHAQLERLRVEQSLLLGPGGFEVPFSSGRGAEHARELLTAHAGRGVDRMIKAYLDCSHDVRRIRERVEHFDRVTRGLKHGCWVLLLLLFAGVYGVLFVAAARASWLPIACAFGAAAVFVVVGFVRAHRALYPERKGERVMKVVLMLLSPPALARARQWLARDLLVEHHPLAIAVALASEDQTLALAGRILRDLDHPLTADDHGAIRRALRAGHAQLLKSLPLPPSAPVRADGSSAYCPRCLALYRDREGVCADCPNIARVPFD